MSQGTPQTPGGANEIPPLEFITLFDFVSDLLKLSPEEKEEYATTSESECRRQVEVLIKQVQSPERPSMTVQDVVGRMFMLHHQTTRLEMDALQSRCEELSVHNARLIACRRDAMTDLRQCQSTIKEMDHKLGLAEQSTQLLMDDEERREMRETRTRIQESRSASPRETAAEAEPAVRQIRESDYDTEDYLASHQAVRQRNPERHAVAPSHISGGARSGPPAPARSLKPQVEDRKGKNKSRPVAKSTYREPSSSSSSSDDYKERRRPLRDASSSSSESDRPRKSERRRRERSPPLRTRQLDSLARDLEKFDPSHRSSNIEDYLREVNHAISDLTHATSREKVRLIWKTTSPGVHTFIETQTSRVRDKYSKLCKALCEEYSLYGDETHATINAIQIKHRRTEAPREFYNRLRHTYFQGSSAPGLENDRAFKSLFIHNLHPCVRNQVALASRQGKPSMAEIRKNAQMTWETVVRPVDKPDEEPRVLQVQSPAGAPLELEGNEVPSEWPAQKGATQNRPPQNHQQGGWKSWQGNGNRRFEGQPRNDWNQSNGQHQGQGNRQQGRHPQDFNQNRFPKRPNNQRGRKDRETEVKKLAESKMESEMTSMKEMLTDLHKCMIGKPTMGTGTARKDDEGCPPV